MKKLSEVWHRYWFRPAPLVDLAITRIVCISVQLWLITVYRQNIEQVLTLVNLPDLLFQPTAIVRLLTLSFGTSTIPALEVVQLVALVTIVSGILALIGLATNLSLSLFTLGNLFIIGLNYSFAEHHHTEALLMVALVALTLSPSGRVLSLDELLSRKMAGRRDAGPDARSIFDRKSTWARWPLLLVRWFFGLAYLSAAMAKLLNAGLDWMNGYTLQYYLSDRGIIRRNPLGIWAGQQHDLAKLFSWFAVLFEGTFWLVLLFPRLAWIYIPAGIGLHLGIFLAMGPDFFEYIALYVVFIPWAKVINFIRSRLSGDRLEAVGELSSE